MTMCPSAEGTRDHRSPPPPPEVPAAQCEAHAADVDVAHARVEALRGDAHTEGGTSVGLKAEEGSTAHGGSSCGREGGRLARPRPRLRETTLGPVDWAAVEPLALSMADRQADSDARYRRKQLSPGGVAEVKQRWQTRQLSRLSNAALIFGPRETVQHLFAQMAHPLPSPPGLLVTTTTPERQNTNLSEHGSARQEEDNVSKVSTEHQHSSMASQAFTVAKRTAASTVKKHVSSAFQRILGSKDGAPKKLLPQYAELSKQPGGIAMGRLTV